MNRNQDKLSLRNLIKKVRERQNGIDCVGMPPVAVAYLVSRLQQELGSSIFIIVPTPKTAEVLDENLHFFLPDSVPRPVHFPPYNILPYKFISYHNETAARRIGTLYRLMSDDSPQIVITTAEALMQKVIPREEINAYAELIMTGEESERDRLVEKLIAGGYSPATIVEEPGDFCVRCGIIDIFSPLYDHPLRIELFGDYAETIRFFSPAPCPDHKRAGRKMEGHRPTGFC